LADIYSFALNPNKTPNEFYCLQTVVIKKCNKETIDKNNLSSDFD